MRLAHLGLLLIVLTIGVRCDRDRSGLDTPVTPPPVPSNEPPPVAITKVRLYLFGAGNCQPCKEELPEVQKWLDSTMASQKERILPLLVFTAGQSGKPATQEDAEQFKKDLGLSFETVADKYGKTYYRQYYKEGGVNVPATVLLKENKEVIKIYPIEKVKLDTLTNDIHEALK